MKELTNCSACDDGKVNDDYDDDAAVILLQQDEKLQ